MRNRGSRCTFRSQPKGRDLAAIARGVAVAAVLSAALAGVAGCAATPSQKPQPWFNPASNQKPQSWFNLGPKPPASQSMAAQLGTDDNPFVVHLTPGSPVLPPSVSQKAVQFRVMQVQVPQGEFSRSQKIWDHLDEQAVGVETQMLLQRNGLRVALGSPESWPPVKAILESVPKRSVRQLPPSLPNSLSVSLQLTGEPVDQTIFFYRPNGTMAGSFYSQASDVLRITWDFHSDNIEQVAVYVTPEIRQEQSGVVFKATPLGAAPVPIYEGRVFSELACRLIVSPNGYIVLGPGADVDHIGLLGREFLVTQIDGEPYESILVIVPEVLDLTKHPAGEAQQTMVKGK